MSETTENDCPICKALAEKAERGETSPGQTCTLHGGAMTATEVEMRRGHQVDGDTWVQRKE